MTSISNFQYMELSFVLLYLHQVKVTNAYTAPLTSSGDAGDNFGLSAYLSANSEVSDGDDVHLVVEVDPRDAGKTSVGVSAGDSVMLNVKGRMFSSTLLY